MRRLRNSSQAPTQLLQFCHLANVVPLAQALAVSLAQRKEFRHVDAQPPRVSWQLLRRHH